MEFNILDIVYPNSGLRENLKAFLDNAGGQEVTINIASEGGSVMEGLAVASLLSEYKGKTIAKGYGVVASIATIIMAACDEREITKNSLFLIHNSWGWYEGNKEQVRKELELNEMIDNIMLNILVGLSKDTNKLIEGDETKTRKTYKKMMTDETWMLPEMALKYGFITSIMEKEREEMSQGVLARIRAQATTYKNLPSNLQNNSQMEDKKNLLQKFIALFGFKAEKLEAIELPEGETVTDAQETQATTAQETTAEEAKVEEKSTENTKMVEEMELLKERLNKLETENAELKAKAAGAPVGKTETNTTKAENSRYTKEQIEAANKTMNAIFNKR